MFTLDGKNVAAGSPPQGEGIPSHWTTYIASDDVDATAEKIREAGGTVLVDPFDVFDAGRMTIAQDPTGATFGVWQAGKHIGAELANDPGTMNWNECQTRDPGAASAFYEAVFGVEVKAFPTAEGRPPYHVIHVDGRGVAGIFELDENMGDVPPNWAHRLRGRRPRRDRREGAGARRDGVDAGHGPARRSAGSRCCRIRPAPSSRCCSRRPELIRALLAVCAAAAVDGDHAAASACT